MKIILYVTLFIIYFLFHIPLNIDTRTWESKNFVCFTYICIYISYSSCHHLTLVQ